MQANKVDRRNLLENIKHERIVEWEPSQNQRTLAVDGERHVDPTASTCGRVLLTIAALRTFFDRQCPR